ncbi:accessory gene regulator B family protein [Clostridium aestuarii]|uniref:Accessory gene regulator B family protein n=1 Tax=Clostridium aestuarii TaxID=338193 RepID=A0ABT4D0L0_9CLOT|nr:accessory gene regulator B family protein [Clostridium aestuarii]MCY6484774.1 accessory gene regulator B family protein [Clostridium aestuarii]
MFLIEKLSTNLASKISSTLALNKNNEEIIAYGAFAFFQMLWAIFIIVLFGIILDVLKESLIIAFTASFLRKYSGGAHANSPNRCAVIGAIVCDGLALAVNKTSNLVTIKLVIIIVIISFLFSYYIIYKLAPVDSSAKPIKKTETKQRLKRSSLILLHGFILMICILLILYYKLEIKYLLISVICVCLGITWQSFTLTHKGHFITNSIDIFLKNISNFIGGNKNEK